MNQTQSAQAAAAAERMDAAAKQCAASTSTQSFGLALSDGKVVQLDNQGNTQASEALKTIDVQPGKKVKAKVTGTVEDNNIVRVASVEVKGKKVNPSSSMGGPAGEVK
jgi:nicotinate-nucleotide pyrophosphorylase